MRISTAFTVLFAFAATGCGRYFPPDRNVQRTLFDQDVVGTWKLTSATIELLKRKNFVSNETHANTISFSQDGTLKFASVDENHVLLQYVESGGSWKLIHDTTPGSGVRARNVLMLNVEKCKTWPMHFREEDGKLILSQTLGDPDEWEFIEYERVK
jgi:hypothetical protein